MPILSANMSGIVFMIAAAGSFVVNDTFLKAASGAMPPLQLLFMRSLMSALWCLPLMAVTGSLPAWRALFSKWVVARNLAEIGLVLCFVFALVQMPLADLSAVAQLSPMLVMVSAAVIFREPLGWPQFLLLALGFVGAMMVVQPTGDGFSPYAVLGLGVAAGTAVRDLVARNISREVPGLVVALGAAIFVLVASVPAGLAFETWVVPGPGALGTLAASGLFLTFGHLLIFMAYRRAPVGVVAPFLYSFTVWAVIAGYVAFGDLPDSLGFAGIALILASGVSVVVLAERARRVGVPT